MIKEEADRPNQIVIGQRVTEEKVVLARQMRREMTRAEAILWDRLRRNGLGVNFRRQQIVDGFIADFYSHQAALVVEVDGPTHEAGYDAQRDQIFAARGLMVLRVRNQDVYERIGFVLSRIRREIRAKDTAGEKPTREKPTGEEPTPLVPRDPPETGG